MESIISPPHYQEQEYVAIPSEVGIGGILRISGDPAVMQEMAERQAALQRQAVLEAPVRALGAIAGHIGTVASTILHEVKVEAKMAVFDTFHGTTYRQARHELLELRARERFLASVGLQEVKR